MPPPAVAILPWGDVFEDWLDPLGVSLDEFRDSFTGSWMFGYAQALEAAGVRPVLVCITSRVQRALVTRHGPTGARLWFLPAARPLRGLRRVAESAPLSGRRAGSVLTRHLSQFLATPPISLARVLREERCVAVLCQEYETPRFDVCVAVGRMLRLPIFATFQGGDYHVSRLERPLRPFALRGAEALIVATASERRRLRETYRLPERKLARIFNPTDVRAWRSEPKAAARRALDLPSRARIVAWHGQVQIHRKGLDMLLGAWERVVAERPRADLHLLVIGRGADSETLAQEVQERRLHGVHLVSEWVHDRDRLRQLLSAADVYAFPSRHEGFPQAPVEAMACGLPVVACAAQGLPDILDSGEGGLVVARDDMEAFAAALGGLLDDPEACTTLGEQARARAERAFSLEVVGAQLRTLLVDRRHSSSPARTP